MKRYLFIGLETNQVDLDVVLDPERKVERKVEPKISQFSFIYDDGKKTDLFDSPYVTTQQFVVDKFLQTIDHADYIIAHNAVFTLSTLLSEIHLLPNGDTFVKKILDKPVVCTMRQWDHRRWWTLDKLHYRLFGCEFSITPERHQSTISVITCFDIFHKMLDMGRPLEAGLVRVSYGRKRPSGPSGPSGSKSLSGSSSPHSAKPSLLAPVSPISHEWSENHPYLKGHQRNHPRFQQPRRRFQQSQRRFPICFLQCLMGGQRSDQSSPRNHLRFPQNRQYVLQDPKPFLCNHINKKSQSTTLLTT